MPRPSFSAFVRFSPANLVRGQVKVLSDYRGAQAKPEILLRLTMLLVPLTAAGLMWWFDGSLAAPGSVLAGIALLAGGFLSAFTHLSTLRLRLTEREETWGEADRTSRDAFDETATHLLLAAYLSGITAFLLVIGMNTSADPQGVVTGWPVWAVSFTGTYVFLLFLIAVPRLYSAYTTVNHVRDVISGSHRGRTGN